MLYVCTRYVFYAAYRYARVEFNTATDIAIPVLVPTADRTRVLCVVCCCDVCCMLCACCVDVYTSCDVMLGMLSACTIAWSMPNPTDTPGMLCYVLVPVAEGTGHVTHK